MQAQRQRLRQHAQLGPREHMLTKGGCERRPRCPIPPLPRSGVPLECISSAQVGNRGLTWQGSHQRCCWPCVAWRPHPAAAGIPQAGAARGTCGRRARVGLALPLSSRIAPAPGVPTRAHLRSLLAATTSSSSSSSSRRPRGPSCACGWRRALGRRRERPRPRAARPRPPSPSRLTTRQASRWCPWVLPPPLQLPPQSWTPACERAVVCC